MVEYDDDSLGCVDIILDSLNETTYYEDNMSSSSRGYSISENTARVTLPDELDYQEVTHAPAGMDYNMLPNDCAHSSSSFSYMMEQPLLDTPYQLKPLIATDIGGFLAAAAFLDGSSDPFCQ